MTSVLFVCLGNICRSPLAEGIFAHLVYTAGLQSQITYDSAGNGAWHDGESPDPRAIRVAAKNNIDISNHESQSGIVGKAEIISPKSTWRRNERNIKNKEK